MNVWVIILSVVFINHSGVAKKIETYEPDRPAYLTQEACQEKVKQIYEDSSVRHSLETNIKGRILRAECKKLEVKE